MFFNKSDTTEFKLLYLNKFYEHKHEHEQMQRDNERVVYYK